MKFLNYIASCSCGNDSMAMVYELIKRNYPLDEVVRYNNGMDFSCVDNLWERLKLYCEPKGIICTELKPKMSFEYKMFEKKVQEKNGGTHFGYSWCGGACRWGTTEKQQILDKYCENKSAFVYVGIAFDEKHRKPDKPYKLHPLKDWEICQTDCLEINRKNGIEWLEPTTETESGYIDLYTILDRVSCWCCANKNQWELYNIWKYLPQYWQKLKDFQRRLTRPFKKEYGIFELEQRFINGYIPKHRTRKTQNQTTLFDFIKE